MELDRYHSDIARIAEGPCDYPKGRFSGVGIVTCAGGRTYFTCAWVLVNLLRRLGCQLPVEVWYRGRHEMSDTMRGLLESVADVRCMNASEHGPACRLDGWEIKPYAIIHSRFEEVLFLDCDNVPTRDPSGVFEEDEYRKFGALFWPDRWMGSGDPDGFRTISPRAWEACDVKERDEPEFESGQMVISKRSCWRALQLAMFFNQHSSFFYRWLLGDKDTFHMAWRRVGQPHGMPMIRPRQDGDDGPVLYQHDYQGRCLFQHRNQDKWDIDGRNLRIPGFRHEETCLEFVRRLQERWDGVVRRYPDDYGRLERGTVERIHSERLFRYAVHGTGLRLVEMKPAFEIGLGKGRWETAWDVEQHERGVSLTLHNGMRKMCVLDQHGDTTWHGRCLHFERAPITVEPITRLPVHQRALAEEIKLLLGRSTDADRREIDRITATGSFLYRRPGHDSRALELISDHTIARGVGALERWWFIDSSAATSRLAIWGELGLSCSLVRHGDGVWRGNCCLGGRLPAELVPGPAAFGGAGKAYYESTAADVLAQPATSYYGMSSEPRLVNPSAAYYGSSADLLFGASGASYYEGGSDLLLGSSNASYYGNGRSLLYGSPEAAYYADGSSLLFGGPGASYYGSDSGPA